MTNSADHVTYQEDVVEDEQHTTMTRNQRLLVDVHYFRHLKFMKELSLRIDQSLDEERLVSEWVSEWVSERVSE